MKRVIKLVIVLGILFLLYQFLVTLFVNQHTMTYSLEDGDKTYQVYERFSKEEGHHDYSVTLTYNELSFPFHLEHDYHKQKQILEKVEVLEEGDTICLYPIFKDAVTAGMICNQNGVIMSYNASLQQGIQTATNFATFLQNAKYQSLLFATGEETINYQNMTIRDNFLPEDYIFAIWNYRGLDIIGRNERSTLPLLDSDHYENTLGTLIGNYYYVPNYDQKYSYHSFYLINLAEPKKKSIDTTAEISYDSYINGVVDAKLYLTDRDQKIEYAYQVGKDAYEVVGSVDAKAKVFQNGVWEEANIYDLTNGTVLFTEKTEIPEGWQLSEIKSIHEDRAAYYILDQSGNLYQVLKSQPQFRTLLLSNLPLTDFQVVEDTVFYLLGDTIYGYQMKDGWHPLITKNEFRFNATNIYTVIKK